jgi:BirA family biotin operon repressor/biotin-[acetyl-CoA-carboxylase] ligase
VRRFAEIDSTNRYLLDAATGGGEGLVVVADHQTAGRGRLGRRWVAPAGANLLVSVLLRPDLPMHELSQCTVAVSLAAADACMSAAALEPELKWPNDLMVGGRKLAGILAESVPAGPGRAVVVGLGLNVQWPAPGPGDGSGGGPGDSLEAVATSLWRETGRRMDPAKILPAVLVGLDRRLDGLQTAEGRALQAAEYRRRCTTLGRSVRVAVSSGSGEVMGTAIDITPEGLLVVELGSGTRTISAGDVYDDRP